MNWWRILLGGAVMFVVGGLSNVIAFITGLVGLVHGEEALAEAPAGQSPSGFGVIRQSIVLFVFCTLPIWLYAAIRPRFGAGLRTAIYASLTLSLFYLLLGSPLPTTPLGVTTSLWGFGPARLVLIQAAIYLPAWLIGVSLGAWLYKEKGTSGKRMAGKVMWSRIVLGGLVAGVFINLSHFLLNVLVKVEASVGVSDHAVLWVLYGLAVGVGGVWIYAAIQPRFRAGLKTAIIAGVATWLMMASFFPLGGWELDHPLETGLVHLVGNLVALCIAMSLGARLYKEEGAAQSLGVS